MFFTVVHFVTYFTFTAKHNYADSGLFRIDLVTEQGKILSISNVAHDLVTVHTASIPHSVQATYLIYTPYNIHICSYIYSKTSLNRPAMGLTLNDPFRDVVGSGN